MIFTHLLRLMLRLSAVLLMGAWAAQAGAQNDPPGRVGRLNHLEGSVSFSPAGDNEWTDAELNRPLTRGDKLWTDRGSRAEIQVGSSAIRMDGGTHVEILALDDQSAQLSVLRGALYVRVRSLPEGENVELDTPNLAYRAAYPGDYRIDVDSTRGTTRVTIHSGTGAVYGEAGQALPLGGGQQITFRGRALAQLAAQESPPQDNFDRWASERNRREDQSVSARYVPREVVGYQSLDAHGQWTRDATHGAVWFPHGTPAHWAPYRFGRWEWIGPWGWTWIDDAPWGFATSHYGRWAQIQQRWAWVPGPIGLRPIYAPALVAFIGGGSGAEWGIPIAAGRTGVAWFPLAPGEAFQPGYKTTPIYVSNVNRNMSPLPVAVHAHQGRPQAITAIAADDFHRGRSVRGDWLRVAASTLTKAQVVPPPPIPEPRVLAAKEKPVTARAAPEIRQVAAAPARPQPIPTTAEPSPAGAAQASIAQQARLAEPSNAAALAAQQRTEQQARVAEQAKAAEQAQVALQRAKAAQQLRANEQARLLAQAKAAEQARRAEVAKAEEAAKLERQDRRAASSRREQLARGAEAAKKREQLASAEQARRETARREQAARRMAQAQRTEQARRLALARRESVAAREEKARRDTHAQRVETARRAAERDAEALRAQRESARRDGLEREQAQRQAWERQQQALSEQWRRDHQAWEQQQRERNRLRPELRNERRPPPPEVWQRGIPILNPGRTS